MRLHGMRHGLGLVTLFVLMSLLVGGVQASNSPDPGLTSAGGPDTSIPPPPGSFPSTRPLDLVEVVTMPSVDNARLVDEEIQRQLQGPGLAPRYAQPLEARLTPATNGTWEILRDGTWLWRLRIQSPAALSLSLGFSTYRMPHGGRLLVYTPDRSSVIGPFTEADNEDHGQLWTPILPGDEAMVEVTLAKATQPQLDLVIGSVNHGFLPFGQLPLSGLCNVDVACSQAVPWRDQVRSVAVIGIAGRTFCTGFVVNNTALDGKPYFLTANHCDVNGGTAASLVVYWNYENSTCRPPGSAASGSMGDGTLDQFNTGSYFRSAYAPSDFTLVELDDPISSQFDVFWAGWDARPGDATSAVTIHHPNTDEKRISFEYDPTSTTSYNSTAIPGDGTHIRVTDWDLGTTEPGSSGSPLFNQDGRVIGQLHGGYASCSNNQSDWYGRFSASWNGGGSPATRLRDWLDPTGAGTTLTLDGRSGPSDFVLKASPSAQSICASDQATYYLSLRSIQGFDSPIALAVEGQPNGAAVDFDSNPITPPATSRLVVSELDTVMPGNYDLVIRGSAGNLTHSTAVGLNVATAVPAPPDLLAPADGTLDVSLAPVFTWSASPQAARYRIEIATDPAFADVIEAGDGLLTTSYIPETPFPTDTVLYWRVQADNACGAGAATPVFSFTTEPGPAACGPGKAAEVLLREDFESGAGNWVHDGDQDTWQLTSQRSYSGDISYRAGAIGQVSDQRLVSPQMSLPITVQDLRLQFWQYRNVEEGRPQVCNDGAILEVSADGGQSWVQLDGELLADPYNGQVSATFSNPLAGLNAWCGNPEVWRQAVADLTAYAGQTVGFRFRLGTDTSISREGWYVDDVAIQSCRDAPDIRIVPAVAGTTLGPRQRRTVSVAVQNLGSPELAWSLGAGELPGGGRCNTPEELPWLDVAPRSGVVGGGAWIPLEVTFDSGRYTGGLLSATLCIDSNDPERPLVELPVMMRVVARRATYLPLMLR